MIVLQLVLMDNARSAIMDTMSLMEFVVLKDRLVLVELVLLLMIQLTALNTQQMLGDLLIARNVMLTEWHIWRQTENVVKIKIRLLILY